MLLLFYKISSIAQYLGPLIIQSYPIYPALISSIWNFRFGVNLGIYALACAFPFSWNALEKIHSASLYFKVEVKSYPLRVLFYADNSVRLFLQWKNEITMRLELIN